MSENAIVSEKISETKSNHEFVENAEKEETKFGVIYQNVNS